MRILALALLFSSVPAVAAGGPEEYLLSQVSTASLMGFLAEVSSVPHLAGTPEGRRVADAIAGHFTAHGLEVKTAEYQVLLSYPEDSALDLVKPSTGSLVRLEGERLPGAAAFARVDRIPWNAYSPSADVTGAVVYANYGRPEDFAALDKLGIELRGRVVLARYGQGYRGGKALEAEKRGAAAIVFYSDPADDGYSAGDEWPKGTSGPPDHFQRGATVYDFMVPGDPLTPGWASTPSARRLKVEQVRILPRIPSLPIAWREAARILAALEGPVAPPGWRGSLPLTYHIGAGPAEVRLVVKNKNEARPIVNVLGYWRGSAEPEKLVILSSHHDAWTRGAVDDGIGTAIALELSRLFGEMAKKGWKPRRSILVASWDAEEYTLTGSTEWGEENEVSLRNDAVAVLNMDAYRWGREFTAIGVPSLRGLVRGALADTPDPASGGSLYDAWAKLAKDRGEEPAIGVMGSGSDYTVFLNRLGVPAVETMFTGVAGAYHSIYDGADWVAKVDPGLAYVAALARVNALMAWRLADAALLPFDYGTYARDIRDELKALAGGAVAAEDLKGSLDALAAWEAAGRQLLEARKASWPADKTACANAALMQVERDLLVHGGLPGRPWFRHLIYAPRPSYEAMTLPGLRAAVEVGDRTKTFVQLEILELALRRAASTQARAVECLR